MGKANEIVDWREWGLLLKTARIMNGYSSASALVTDLHKRTGLTLSARSIYAFEEGEHVPSAEVWVGLQMLLPELRDPERLRPVFKQDGVKVVLVELK